VVLENTLSQNSNGQNSTDLDNNYSARPIDILGVTAAPSDLLVTNIVALASASSGVDYSFTYTVKNRGANVSGVWYDAVYLTDDPDLSKAKDIFLLGSYKQERNLIAGDSYSVAQTVQLSPAVQGKYLIVRTDAGQYSAQSLTSSENLVEISEANNALAFASIISAQVSDLQVLSVQTQPQSFSGEETLISWTVKNLGADVWSGTQSWIDTVYISSDPQFVARNAIKLADVVHSNLEGLISGASYTTSVNIKMPPGTDGPYYIYVVTDASRDDRVLVNSPNNVAQFEQNKGYISNKYAAELYKNSVYEGALNVNNMGRGSININYREPDLVVDEIVGKCKNTHRLPLPKNSDLLKYL
jgi:hypothetical protein